MTIYNLTNKKRIKFNPCKESALIFISTHIVNDKQRRKKREWRSNIAQAINRMEDISHRYKVLPLPSANLVRFLKALGLGLLICQINITPTIYTTQISVR